MTTYHINLTVKKRWFKSPQIVYKLIKYTEEEQWVDPTYGNGGGDFITVKKETVKPKTSKPKASTAKPKAKVKVE